MFRSVNLGGLAKDGRSTLTHELVGGDTQRRVCRDAAVSIRATAVHRQGEFGNRLCRPLQCVDIRQHSLNRLDSCLDGFSDATGLLYGQEGGSLFAILQPVEMIFIDQTGNLIDLAAQPNQHITADVWMTCHSRYDSL